MPATSSLAAGGRPTGLSGSFRFERHRIDAHLHRAAYWANYEAVRGKGNYHRGQGAPPRTPQRHRLRDLQSIPLQSRYQNHHLCYIKGGTDALG